MAIDATTLEANAAMRSIVRRDTGASYEEFLRGLAQASGIETPTREELARLDRKRKKRIGRADAALERGSSTGARGVRQLRNRSNSCTQIRQNGADNLFFCRLERQGCRATEDCRVGERVYHVRHHEHDRVKIMAFP